MKSRERFARARTFKWAGLVATCCIALLLLGSLRWTVALRGSSAWIMVTSGGLSFGMLDWRSSWLPGMYCETCASWDEFASCFWRFGLAPTARSDEDLGVMEVTVPLWIPLALVGVPTIWLGRRERRLARVGCCAACGYNLTGNTSGRCPECGKSCAPNS